MCELSRLLAHADDPDIDEALKPDVGHTLGADDKTPGIITIIV